MKRLCILLHMVSVCAITVVRAQSFDERLTAVKKKIFAQAGYSVPVSITNDQINSSIPDKGIFISRLYFDQVYKTKDKSLADKILTFILAHEFAHQIQFDKYKNEVTNISSCEKRTLFEAQADIIAGYYYAKVYELYKIAGSESVPADGLIFREIYFLGDQEFALGTHPSFKQRRNAFRLGMAYEVVKNSSVYANNESVQSTMDLSGDESFLDWSLKTAKRITHFPSAALHDIVVVRRNPDAPRVRYDTSSSNPIVSYNDTIANIGNRPIEFYIQYKVIGVDRKIEDESALQLQGPSKSHKVLLKPGEKAVLKGVLNWSKVATKQYMPSMPGIPDNNLLYSAEYADKGDVGFDTRCPGNQYGSSKVASEKINLSDALLLVSRKARDNFIELTNGTIGVMNEYYLSYQSNYQIPTATKTEISKDNDDSSYMLYVDFYSGEDQGLADKMFNSFVSELRSLEERKLLEIEKDYDYRFKDEDGFPVKGPVTKRGIMYSKESKDILKAVNLKTGNVTFSVRGQFRLDQTSLTLSYDRYKSNKEYSITLMLNFEK